MRVDIKAAGVGDPQPQGFMIGDGDYHSAAVMAHRISGNFALVANTLYAVPLYVARSRTADGIAVRVTAGGGVGTSARLGVYRDNGSIYPGSLLLDAGTVSVSSSGVKTISISLGLPADELLWLAIVSDGTPSVSAVQVDAAIRILGVASGNLSTGYTYYSVAFTFAALPATFTAGGTKGNGAPPSLCLSLA